MFVIINKCLIKVVIREIILVLAIIFFLQTPPMYWSQDIKNKPESKKIIFSENIRPIFEKNCLSCHNRRSFFFGGLRLNSLDWIQKGGHSGPAIVASRPGESLLYQFIKSGRMPPVGNKPLNQQEIQLIEEWIRQGAK